MQYYQDSNALLC